MENVKENRSVVLFIILMVAWVFVMFFVGALVPAVVKYSVMAFNLEGLGLGFGIALGINAIYLIICQVITFIYYRRWIEDVNLICDGDGQNTQGVMTLFLLSYVTFGIYAFFWIYNIQNRLKSNAPRYNVVISDSGSTVLLWNILGSLLLGIGPLMAVHIMFDSTNKLAHAYNQNYGTVSAQITPPPAAQITPPAAQMTPPVAAQVTPPAAPQMTPSVPMQQEQRMGQVKCIKGAAAGQGFRLPANTKVVVGKNPGKATLVINESYVSNVHCTIQYNAGNNTYIVTDHSTNGTFANGVRLQKEIPMTYPAGTVLMLVNENIKIKLG